MFLQISQIFETVIEYFVTITLNILKRVSKPQSEVNKKKGCNDSIPKSIPLTHTTSSSSLSTTSTFSDLCSKSSNETTDNDDKCTETNQNDLNKQDQEQDNQEIEDIETWVLRTCSGIEVFFQNHQDTERLLTELEQSDDEEDEVDKAEDNEYKYNYDEDYDDKYSDDEDNKKDPNKYWEQEHRLWQKKIDGILQKIKSEREENIVSYACSPILQYSNSSFSKEIMLVKKEIKEYKMKIREISIKLGINKDTDVIAAPILKKAERISLMKHESQKSCRRKKLPLNSHQVIMFILFLFWLLTLHCKTCSIIGKNNLFHKMFKGKNNHNKRHQPAARNSRESNRINFSNEKGRIAQKNQTIDIECKKSSLVLEWWRARALLIYMNKKRIFLTIRLIESGTVLPFYLEVQE